MTVKQGINLYIKVWSFCLDDLVLNLTLLKCSKHMDHLVERLLRTEKRISNEAFIFLFSFLS